MSETRPEGEPTRSRARLTRILLLVAVCVAAAGAFAYRQLAGKYRVVVLAPGDGTLVTGQFRVDLALAGTRTPDAIEVLVDGEVVGRAAVSEDLWVSPGSALLSGIAADVRYVTPGRHTLTTRILGGPLSSVESQEVHVLVASSSPLDPLDDDQLAATRAVFSVALPKAVVALDEARRIDRRTWPQDAVYRKARLALLDARMPDDVRVALDVLFQDVERGADQESILAGDRLNLLFERHGIPLWVTVNASHTGNGGKETFVLSYALEKPLRLSVGTDEIEALVARRLDTLNIRELMLGHRSNGAARAVLLADQIDQKAADLTQCLAESTAECALRLRDLRGEYTVADEVLKRAIGAMRRELGAATSGACEAGVSEPCRAAVRDVLRGAVAHHEVRHVFDHRHGLPFAASMRTMLGSLRSKYLMRDSADLPSRLKLETASYNTIADPNAELSAYLAELAEGEGARLFHLLTLHVFLTDARYTGTNEAYAARAIFTGLGKAAEAYGDEMLDADPADPRWSEALDLLARLAPDEIARIASRLYEAEFGRYARARRVR